MDSHTLEPSNIVGLHAGVGNPYRSTVYGCYYESALLVGEPIVPDLWKIVVAAPDVLGDL